MRSGEYCCPKCTFWLELKGPRKTSLGEEFFTALSLIPIVGILFLPVSTALSWHATRKYGQEADFWCHRCHATIARKEARHVN